MNITKSIRVMVAGTILLGSLSFLNGCGGISEAQCNELNSLRSKAKTMQDNIEASKKQKTKLEEDIAAKNKRLDECKKELEATKANIEKKGQ